MSDDGPRKRIAEDEGSRPAPYDAAPNIQIVRGVPVGDDGAGPGVRIGPPRTPLTYAIIALCVGITALLNFVPLASLPISFSNLAPPAVRIWHGALWGLVSSAFVHVAVWHLAFNMWWARDFGRLLEPAFGLGRYVGFIVAAAIVSSGWQLLVSGATGIGFSGVVYALFGYVAVRRRSNDAFAAFLTRQTMLWMLGWLVVCIGLTYSGSLNVANGAHIAGLAFGCLVGLFYERPKLRLVAGAGLAVLAIGVVLSASYMPWSGAWRDRHRPAHVTTPDGESE